MSPSRRQLLYLILTLLTFVAGYAFLRYAYRVSDSLPFAQEIVLIVLGTIATVFITSLLLNKQSAVEIEKEQNIKFLHLKTEIYEALLNLMEELSLKERLEPQDLMRLRFLTHKLAIVASPDVLEEYRRFLDIVTRSAADGSFRGDDAELSEALCALTIRIRADLLGESPRTASTDNPAARTIVENARKAVELRR